MVNGQCTCVILWRKQILTTDAMMNTYYYYINEIFGMNEVNDTLNFSTIYKTH